MRLRLSVCRHKLPPADLLWAVPQDKAQDGFTIAQLLDQVNEIIPLESPHWGLEDYAVEIGSFEALHFQKVKDVLKDEDHVCIRHLTQSELRARHVSGRDQINANGQHLIDGLPFGKSYFASRKPYRPAINIPPLKNPVSDAGAEDAFPGLLMGGPQTQDHGSAGQDDEDLVAEQPVRKRRRVGSAKCDKSDKNVHFQEQRVLTALPSDDDTEDEYQADTDSGSDISSGVSDSSLDDSSSSLDDSSSSLDDSSSSLDDSSSALAEQNDAQMADPPSTDDSESTASSSDTSSSDSSSDSSSSDSSDSGSGPDEISSKALTGIPHEGKARTKSRNRRRRLTRLKRQMQEESEKAESGVESEMRKKNRQAKMERKAELEKMMLILQPFINSPPRENDFKQKSYSANENAINADGNPQENQEMIVETHEDHVKEPAEENVVGGAQEPSSKEAEETTVKLTSDNATETIQGDTPRVKEAAAPKRKRLDIGSSRRLLMGSLGHRTPKNKEEEDKLREKIAASVSARGKKKFNDKASAQGEEDQEPEDLQGEDAWKSRIVLKAFEVLDDVQELSAPPFPFQQRWDPQQQYENKKKRKRGKKNQDKQEEYFDEYYGEGEGEDEHEEEWGYLDYDEVEGNAAQSQLLQETADAQAMDDDAEPANDLPALPSDISTLPILATENMRPDSIIVYKQMEVSELTGWQPSLSDYRTAKVLDVEEDAVHLELAARDIPCKKPDNNKKGGKREPTGKGFEMPTEEDVDPGKRWVDFMDILELRLLEPAPNDEGTTNAHTLDTNEQDLAAEN
ncbi:hypothetical protein GTA08_BOTSDO09875 [Neofusicoccum parvum]|uniref:Uncharacterized protein n=1 Tax=Neofusicoccum parvum TaxID=310453 RepID=A0ACB5RRQ9_9PEZI|nr:hypothetical protein GTA08_BOTSDO09875 [Neofusicoccum parvum]